MARLLTIFLLLFSSFYLSAADLAIEYEEVMDLYRAHKNGELSPVIEPALGVLNRAKEEQNTFYLVKSYFLVAYLYERTNDYGKAIIYYLEGARNAEISESPDLVKVNISIHKNLASILDDYHHFDLTHRFNDRAIQIASSNGIKSALFGLIGINKVHYLIEEERYHTALSLVDSVFNHFELSDMEYIHLYNKKGNIYDRLGNIDSAYIHFKKALEYDYHTELTEYSYALRNLSYLSKLKGAYDSSLYYLEVCEKIVVQELKKNVNELKFDIESRKAEIAVAQNNPTLAERHFLNALEYIGEQDLATDYFEIYQNISEFYESRNNLAKALEYKTLYSDAVNDYLAQQREIEELDKKYNIDLLTERYFELLAANEEKREAVRTAQISLGSIIFLLCFALFYMIYQKQKMKSDLKKTLVKIESEFEV